MEERKTRANNRFPAGNDSKKKREQRRVYSVYFYDSETGTVNPQNVWGDISFCLLGLGGLEGVGGVDMRDLGCF
jgi:hypothetical protein